MVVLWKRIMNLRASKDISRAEYHYLLKQSEEQPESTRSYLDTFESRLPERYKNRMIFSKNVLYSTNVLYTIFYFVGCWLMFPDEVWKTIHPYTLYGLCLAYILYFPSSMDGIVYTNIVE